MIEKIVVIDRERPLYWQMDEWLAWSPLVRAGRLRGCVMWVPEQLDVFDDGALLRGFLAHESPVRWANMPKRAFSALFLKSMNDAEMQHYFELVHAGEAPPHPILLHRDGWMVARDNQVQNQVQRSAP